MLQASVQTLINFPQDCLENWKHNIYIFFVFEKGASVKQSQAKLISEAFAKQNVSEWFPEEQEAASTSQT